MKTETIPELVAASAQKALSEYCERTLPQHVRHEIRLQAKQEGNAFTVMELYVHPHEEDSWIEQPIAQFRYAKGLWKLYYMDNDLRWRPYSRSKPSRDLQTLIDALDADETGIFWGW
jgi:hypothetical protein